MFLFVSAFFFLICVSVPLYFIVFSVFHWPKCLTFHNTLNVRFVPNIVPAQKKTRRKPNLQRAFVLALYTHGDSNSNRWNRNPIFYPLNYGCLLENAAKVKRNFD